MNIAIILAGGTGTRLGSSIPKQYIEVSGRPIISYCLDKFEKHNQIDGIVIVASDIWQSYISKWIKYSNIKKFLGFAPAGGSRQHSIMNGMIIAQQFGAKSGDNIIIHDAARPNVSEEIISRCLDSLVEYDGAMPVLPVKDTIYMSKDKKQITSLLDRDCLFAGQAPEGFNFGKYFHIHVNLTEKELNLVHGSSEIAYKNGLRINLIQGDERNYKITTSEDLNKFIREIEEVER